MPSTLEFFAGSGLVGEGLTPYFDTFWANDICPKKAEVFRANHPNVPFHLGGIEEVSGRDLPAVDLAWASFPCQDLSLAGNLTGLRRGTRSGLFWEWVRVLKELNAHGKRPPLLVAENVVGFVVADQGKHFRKAYRALRDLGYKVGALIIDAKMFLPQSRPRAFVVAVSEEIQVDALTDRLPSRPFHTEGLVRTAAALNDPNWLWWSLPQFAGQVPTFADICEPDAPWDSPTKTRTLRAMLSPVNQRKLETAIRTGAFIAGTGYRRTRPNESGKSQQRLEIRFDGVAGCLRTPNGGSSRQIVMLVDHGTVRTRLLTVRECARLMGAPETYTIPGTYNDGYRAMGDAVAVPVTRWLAGHLLEPLARQATELRAPNAA